MSDKTEAPTSRRLEEARSEGRVVRSMELNTAVIILVGALLLRGPGGSLAEALKNVITTSITSLPEVEITQKWLGKELFSLGTQVLPPLGIILFGLLVTGVVATVAQTGFLWSSKKIGFDFNRVNPVNGLKRIFSTHGLIELGRALLKLGVIGWIAYSFLKKNIPTLIGLSQFDFRTSIVNFASLAMSLTLSVGEGYLILAAADYIYQRWDLMRNLRMTKEEVKEEVKRSEGDPVYKGRIRSQQRQMARRRMMSNVPKATVIVTNPTHLAIAIEYKEKMNAPRVLAKGALHVAEKIVAVAREHRIPIVQNIPLAHALFRTVEVEEEISPDLYRAMAEVLAYVYRLRGK